MRHHRIHLIEIGKEKEISLSGLETVMMKEDYWMRPVYFWPSMLHYCGAAGQHAHEDREKHRPNGIMHLILMPISRIVPGHVRGEEIVTRRIGNRKENTRSAVSSFRYKTPKLSRLSWETCRRENRVHRAQRRNVRRHARRTRPTNARRGACPHIIGQRIFLSAVRGDIVAMLIVFVATLAGYRLKQVMLDDGRDVRLTFLCSAFFCDYKCGRACVRAGGRLLEIALGTSVLSDSGVPYINSIKRYYRATLSVCAEPFYGWPCPYLLSVGRTPVSECLILGLNWF